MKYSHLFLKTTKGAKQFDSINATLLQQGGFIHQTMAGVYTFLPLGWRVLSKIETIIREEMDTLGAEMLMPAIVPEALWETTGRLSSVDVLLSAQAANEASQRKNDGRYVLNPTHEEVITPIALQLKPSYKDLPFAVYQIQTKYRNEERPKSGLLRGREFRMKDLYSFHATEEDLQAFYERTKGVYTTIFDRLGLGDDTVIASASGGDFTQDFSHEFNTRCETGEDTVFYDEDANTYYNAEVVPEKVRAAGNSFSASEVGNIFPLGTKFSEAFGYRFRDHDGSEQPVIMASYGIGSSRVMGVLVEKYHDDRGIIWPAAVAPFAVHLIALQPGNKDVRSRAESLYEQLCTDQIEVLYDDREGASPGEMLADADLLGCPWRAVISEKTGDQVEVKKRNDAEVNLLSVDAFLNAL